MSRVIKKVIETSKAYAPVAPYSQAVQSGNTLYISGIIGIDNKTLKLVPGGAGPETKQILETLGIILEAGKSSYKNVLKTTIYLEDMKDFKAVNDAYTEVFVDNFPARVCYQVGKLPAGALVEIESIAVVED